MKIAIKNGVVKGVIEGDESRTELVASCEQEEKEKEEGLSMLSLIKKLAIPNTMIFLFFFTLLSDFPGALIQPDLFGWNMGIKINTILLVFNLSDTVGRKLANKIEITIKNLYKLFAAILVVIASIIFTVYASKSLLLPINTIYAFTLINPILLAIVNGMGNCLCYAIAPSQVEKKWAARAGSCISLFLVIGLFCGSLASFPVQKITNSFSK